MIHEGRVGGSLVHSGEVRSDPQLRLEVVHHRLRYEQPGRHIADSVAFASGVECKRRKCKSSGHRTATTDSTGGGERG